MRTIISIIIITLSINYDAFPQASMCAAGEFYDSGTNSCISCPAGSVQPNSGQTECLDCMPGSFQDLTGGMFCQDCPVGRFQPNFGAENCMSCPLGRYQPDPGQTSCLECPAGTYSDVPEATSCKPCATGETSPAGSISALACVASSGGGSGSNAIPTVSEWALIILSVSLMIITLTWYRIDRRLEIRKIHNQKKG